MICIGFYRSCVPYPESSFNVEVPSEFMLLLHKLFQWANSHWTIDLMSVASTRGEGRRINERTYDEEQVMCKQACRPCCFSSPIRYTGI